MRDTILLRCEDCGRLHHYTVKFIEGVLKGMRIEKAYKSAYQMKHKSGPFYDKWLAAMEKRGEPKRCKDCRLLGEHFPGTTNYYRCRPRGITQRGWYACKKIIYHGGHPVSVLP